MRRDDVLAGLFPGERAVSVGAFGVVSGHGVSAAGVRVAVKGIADGLPVGVEAALGIADGVIGHLDAGGGPLVVLVDTQSQAMARRDELLGLNECLAHLTKCLVLASLEGCRTVGVLHGAAAAGAFIATALATEVLVAVPGAAPSVMDLPSIARVTKLPLERIEGLAKRTPIFAPGIGPLSATGAVAESWDKPEEFATRLDALLAAPFVGDRRDALGSERGGRMRAASVADLVRRAGPLAPAGPGQSPGS